MEDAEWETIQTEHEEQTIKGIKLLKHYMLDYEEFEKTELFKNGIPFLLVDNLKEKIKDIQSIVYDDSCESLFVLTDDDQYKFSEEGHVMMLNDLPIIDTKSIYVPADKTLVKK